MPSRRILIVDDEPAVRFGLRDFLETHGYEVAEADSCAAARAAFAAARPDAALLDYRLGDGDAMALLRQWRESDPEVPLLVLTAHASIDLAVQAVKEGAEHFLTKPVELPALRVVLERVLQRRREQRTHAAATHAARSRHEPPDPLQGRSAAIQALAAQARLVAGSDSPVLIQGETGSGKGVLAAWLHRRGPRAAEPFVDLNCAGLSREFFETELFGHEKGAFTGAVAAKPGLLEVAHGGTLFLDEIGDVDPQVQPRLLKVLEERRLRRLGAVRDREVDVRLIAATNRDLRALVREGRFRSDLYFRISTLPLRVPPLRERVEDIGPLAQALLARVGTRGGRAVPPLLTDAALAALQRYSWPGNVRELRNVLERAALLCEDGRIGPRDLALEEAPPGETAAADGLELSLAELERRHIERVLRAEGGRVEAAARRLGIPRSTLYQRLKLHGIAPSRS